MDTQDVLPENSADWRSDDPDGTYLLRLFVTGMTPRSTEAISRIKAICEEYLEGRYKLEVVDIYNSRSRPEVSKLLPHRL